MKSRLVVIGMVGFLLGIGVGYIPGCASGGLENATKVAQVATTQVASQLPVVVETTSPTLTTKPAVVGVEKVLNTTSQILTQAEPIAQSIDVVTNPSSSDNQKIAAIAQAVNTGSQIGAAAVPQYGPLIAFGGGILAMLITSVGGIIAAHKSATSAVNAAHQTAQMAISTPGTTPSTTPSTTPIEVAVTKP